MWRMFGWMAGYTSCYLLPERMQQLVYPAIQPNIRHNRWLGLQVPLLLLAEFVALVRLMRQIRPDVLYSHWFTPQGIVGGFACMLLHVPHVFTSHSSDVQILRSLPLLGPWLVRYLVRRVAACSVVSRRSLEKLRAFFSDADWAQLEQRVRIIPMGVDVGALQALPGQSESPVPSGPVILFMGRLSEKKGITYLLQAFERLCATGGEFPAELWIAGDGELAPRIEAEIAERRLQRRVRMLGYLVDGEKAGALVAAHVLVVPSIVTEDGDAEGLPVSLMEGLAAGKLCVATDVSGADELIVDGENGLLVGQKDVAALADALARALAMDNRAASTMRRKARDTAASLDWSLVAERHWEHLFLPLKRSG